MNYASLPVINADIAEILRPPRRVSVSQCAAEVVRIESPGGYSGPWDPSMTPYMVEPMDMLKSRRHEAVVFVAPARTGKTQGLLDGWLAHCVVADPGDIGLYFSTQALAHDYRKRRVERMHRNSSELAARISRRKHDTTIEMVQYRNGMIMNLGWPTSSQLAQRDLRYVALSDYDSFPDDVGGEGEVFGLARKRVQVAMSAGMALVESSPKREILTNNWIPDGPHAAPPVHGGVLPLYNRGDRRRWYWRCIDGCGERFEAPSIPLYDPLPDPEEAGATAHVDCPHCGQVYRPKDKARLNASGIWQREGNRTSSIASFWLLGCAAAFQPWQSIVANYLIAYREMETSGDESALRQTTNTDQGMPYMARAMAEMRGVEALEARLEASERYYVPDGCRTLLGLVDVQANRFEVLVLGFGVAGEQWLIDRYDISRTASNEPVQPAVMREHWDELTRRVVNSTYKLRDGMELRIYRVGIDSGGYVHADRKADSTARAYDWWRSLRAQGLAHRVRLLKGASTKTAATVRETFPDSRARPGRKAGSAGDVPVLMINTTHLKDRVSADLARDVPGPGYIHLPDWLPKKYRNEIVAEQRTAKGWQPVGRRRNETWDLLVYARALWLHAGGDKIRWDAPPAWAATHELNSEAISSEQRKELKAAKNPQHASSGQQRGATRRPFVR